MTSSYESDYIVKKITTIPYSKKTDYEHQHLKDRAPLCLI